jgi:predicted nucleic acid-binding protein
VIVLDANVLLYAYDSTSAQHVKARQWVERAFSEETTGGIALADGVRISKDHDQS